MVSNLKRTSVHALFLSSLFAAGLTHADVQYRIAYEADQDEYVVYMKPDSVPSPDLALSAQVTLAIPHTAHGDDFVVSDIQSAVDGIQWHLHSTVKGPAENPEADYLSFGLMITGGTPPNFGWVTGEEKRIFSFRENNGCRAGVALLENDDAFNQLPNSVSTNPGNQFTNLGWATANNYLGNYGGAVVCSVAQPDEDACRRSAWVSRKLDWQIENLQQQVAILEKQKAALVKRQDRTLLKIDELQAEKTALTEACPVATAPATDFYQRFSRHDRDDDRRSRHHRRKH